MGIFQENNSVIITRTRDDKKVNLRKAVKSRNNIKAIFSYIDNVHKLKLIIYNKAYQKLFGVNYDIKYIKEKSGRKIVGERNGEGKEYTLETNKLLFKGNYLNGKRNGEGEEYYSNGELKFKGEYLNGKRLKGKGYNLKGDLIMKLEKNGEVREYYTNGMLKFKGKYFIGRRWNGKGYNLKGSLEFEIQNGKGSVREYNDNDNTLEYEGEIYNGKRNGKGKEYQKYDKTYFKGEFRNGFKHGKGKEYYDYNKLKSEGEYREGIQDGKWKYYFRNGKLQIECEYLNGKKKW